MSRITPPPAAGADARDALASLLEIRAGIEALNHQLAAEGAPVMRMRLGVHSGMVLAGSIGSSERLEYAISGDTVKCAWRIESLEKDRHDGLHGQRWGDFQVKGRLEPLETWELRNGCVGSCRCSTTTAAS